MKLRELPSEKELQRHDKHDNCWIEAFYCKTHKIKLTQDEIFNMGYNYAVSEIISQYVIKPTTPEN